MRSLALPVLLAASALSPAQASGQLDPRFDADGVRVLDAGQPSGAFDLAFDGLFDQAGRIVAVGRSVQNSASLGHVLRMNPLGELDSTFGQAGIVRIPPPDGFGQSRLVAVVEQSDGKLVVAGDVREPDGSPSNISRAYVCRLHADGALDSSFGSGGCAQPAFWVDSNHDIVFALALQQDGRLVIMGQTDLDGVGYPDYVVARLNSDGSYDRCFGDVSCTVGGLLIKPEPEADLTSFSARALALAPDGRIVLAGDAMGAVSRDMAAIRLLPTGEVDQSFGNGGHRLVAFDQGGSNFDAAQAVTVGPNGAVLLAGSAPEALSISVAVAALDANGTLIPGFGSGGRTTFYFNDVTPVQNAHSVKLQADGKVLLGGLTSDLENGDFYADCGIARLLPNGQLDPAFGVNGTLTLDAGLGLEPARSDGCFALDANARSVVLFGLTQTPNSNVYDSLFIKLDQDDLFRDGFDPD